MNSIQIMLDHVKSHGISMKSPVNHHEKTTHFINHQGPHDAQGLGPGAMTRGGQRGGHFQSAPGGLQLQARLRCVWMDLRWFGKIFVPSCAVSCSIMYYQYIYCSLKHRHTVVVDQKSVETGKPTQSLKRSWKIVSKKILEPTVTANSSTLTGPWPRWSTLQWNCPPRMAAMSPAEPWP